jgi:2-polyprenyl-3-methyl-5-hydroxy-6-metoxy-1,4-benzoquinol methylase
MADNREKLILGLIDKTSTSPRYQTVEVGGKVIRYGSEQCWKTWDNIIKLGFNFKDCVVYDLGCFNGYFSFKSFNSGAKEVVGIDLLQSAVDTYNYICNLYDYNKCVAHCKNLVDCDFFEKKADVTLCLNMLHYVKMKNLSQYENLLKYIFDNSHNIIVEINENEIPDFELVSKEKNFKLMNRITSHRNTMYGQRYILFYSSSKNLSN